MRAIDITRVNASQIAAMFGQGPIAPCKINDVIEIAPTIDLPDGRAWRIDLDEARKRHLWGPEEAQVDGWVIEVPWANCGWHSYAVTCVHLRDIPGTAPPLIYRKDATHEVMVHAMNPAQRREGVIRGWQRLQDQLLHPTNYAGQFIEVSDELARDRIQRAVTEICSGELSPDTDFLAQWAQRFGGHMIKGHPDAKGLVK